MQGRIVARKPRAVFAGLNRGHAASVTSEWHASAEHCVVGHHAPGGTRRTPKSIARWYDRLLRLMPDIRFDIERIDVAGPSWRTLALVRWHESNAGTNGVRTENQGVNVIEIAWGTVRSVRIYTDTVVLQQTRDRLAAHGVEEARFPPIES